MDCSWYRRQCPLAVKWYKNGYLCDSLCCYRYGLVMNYLNEIWPIAMWHRLPVRSAKSICWIALLEFTSKFNSQSEVGLLLFEIPIGSFWQGLWLAKKFYMAFTALSCQRLNKHTLFGDLSTVPTFVKTSSIFSHSLMRISRLNRCQWLVDSLLGPSN